MQKTCSYCKKHKDFNEFGPHKNGKDGLKARCRACLREIGRKDFAKDKEKILDRCGQYYIRNKKSVTETINKWRKQNPEKVKQIATDFAKRNNDKLQTRRRRFRNLYREVPIDKIANKQHMICYYCGERFERLYYDHVIPISKGGQDTAGNLVACCRSCNSRKKDMLIIQFKRHSQQMGYKLRINSI